MVGYGKMARRRPMSAALLGIALMAALAGCSGAKGTEYLRYGETAYGKVDGRKVAFRDFQNGAWADLKAETFTLPEGTRSVFSFGQRGIGVVVKDEARCYSYRKMWTEVMGSRLALPKGYLGVCGLGEESLAVKMKNAIRIYWFTDGAWREVGDAFLAVPPDVGQVCSVGPSLALERGKAFDLCYWNGGEWRKDDSAAFHPPKGMGAAFGYGSSFLAVKAGGTLRFFQLSKGEWAERPEMATNG